MKRVYFFAVFFYSLAAESFAQVSKVWVSDQGNGMYKNPVLHADYSDPDAIRVGNDYYMTASSFEDVPGLPILHSKDLVNWTLIGHALKNLIPREHFSTPRHGEGVWAPSLRHHKGLFYLYYPDPDFGIYLTTSKQASGPWSDPVLVVAGKGLIDPCPLWDEDGQAYLVHAYAGSRAGIKSILVIRKMNAEGTKTLDEGVLVYDGHETDPTIEGPKLYKRNGYYYIFAPAGGVATGWQLVLRSRSIYGPYERKVVMDQGKTPVNGPHQGAWVTTQTGEDWFLHFQDKEAYGRVVHLQPVKWSQGWPVIGADADGDGKGEPVLLYKKPHVGQRYPVRTPADSDEFNGRTLGLQWQWMANPQPVWAFVHPSAGVLRLFSARVPDSAYNLWETPAMLQQKFPADSFMVTTKLGFKPNPKLQDEQAGLAVMGLRFAAISIKSSASGNLLVYTAKQDAAKKESIIILGKAEQATVYFRVKVSGKAQCRFSYSFDGISFVEVPETFIAAPGKWKGAKLGIFCSRLSQTNDAGYADYDWFRVERLP